MIVRRFFEAGLAQTSYLVGCREAGEALVIDPNRDIEMYVRAAEEESLRIAHVTETHIHADFLSGSRELARRTGATVYLSDEGGADWKYQFIDEGRRIRDGDRLIVGRVLVDVVHTPGHTPEHLTFLITDGAVADRPLAAATGDFIFVGDVGRPDLLERAANYRGTMEQSARALYRSLHAFETAHDDWLQIWPGHGAGSACGKGISAVPYSTLGYERRFNWAFAAGNEDAFVGSVLAGQPEPPKYFARMKQVNKAGPPMLNGLQVPEALDPGRLAALVAEGIAIVDTRPAAVYAAGHARGTINIPLGNTFATWIGSLVDYERPLYLIVDTDVADRVGAAMRALALIGRDRVDGLFEARALAGAASGARQQIAQIEASAVGAALARGEMALIDVRGEAEWQSGHIPGAIHIPLGGLPDRLAEIPSGRPAVVHCQSGARSAIAASILERAGLDDVRNMTGGYLAWQSLVPGT